MHIFILRDELLKACQNVVGAVERRQTLNILSNVLLEVEKNSDRLNTTATDLELELKSFGLIKNVVTPGKITVSAAKLVDICRTLPKGSEIEMKLEANQMLIRAGQRVFNLVTLPASEYPNIEEVGKGREFILKQSELKTILNRTAFAIPDQDVRYFLNGMLFEIDGGNFNFVATDGHRLAFAGMNFTENKAQEKVQAIIPRKTIFELSTLLSTEDKEIKVVFSKNHLIVESNDFKMTSKLIDGKYPNYNRVIPNNCDKAISVDTEEFKISLNCISILANESYRGMRMFLSNNLMQMSANNNQQEEADERVNIEYEGPDAEMAFNVDYVMDICKIVASDKTIINFSGSNAPILVEENYGNARYIYVVMPMRI